MLTYYQLNPWEQPPVKFELSTEIFHSRKYILKRRLQNCGHLVSVSFRDLFVAVTGIPLCPQNTRVFVNLASDLEQPTMDCNEWTVRKDRGSIYIKD